MKQERGLSAGQTEVVDARQVEETEDTDFGGRLRGLSGWQW